MLLKKSTRRSHRHLARGPPAIRIMALAGRRQFRTASQPARDMV
jgi:hypothetical protein